MFLGIGATVEQLSFNGYSKQTWLNLILLAIIATVLGQMLINYVMKWLSATVTSVYILLEPVGSILLAWLISNQTISLTQTGGVGLILLGLIIFNQNNKEKNNADYQFK